MVCTDLQHPKNARNTNIKHKHHQEKISDLVDKILYPVVQVPVLTKLFAPGSAVKSTKYMLKFKSGSDQGNSLGRMDLAMKIAIFLYYATPFLLTSTSKGEDSEMESAKQRSTDGGPFHIGQCLHKQPAHTRARL